MGFQADFGVPVIRVQLGRSPAAFLQQASGCFGCPLQSLSESKCRKQDFFSSDLTQQSTLWIAVFKAWMLTSNDTVRK